MRELLTSGSSRACRDQRVLLVMEHMEGGSLAALLRNEAIPIDLDVKIRWLRDIAQVGASKGLEISVGGRGPVEKLRSRGSKKPFSP